MCWSFVSECHTSGQQPPWFASCLIWHRQWKPEINTISLKIGCVNRTYWCNNNALAQLLGTSAGGWEVAMASTQCPVPQQLSSLFWVFRIAHLLISSCSALLLLCPCERWYAHQTLSAAASYKQSTDVRMQQRLYNSSWTALQATAIKPGHIMTITKTNGPRI